MPGGFGTNWGGGPWGGADLGLGNEPVPPGFDVYCFSSGSSMAGILSAPNVSTVDGGNQFFITPDDDLEMRSGGIYATDDARLEITSPVSLNWTLQYVVNFEKLPNDFNTLVANHIFVGTTDDAGPCAGLFFSKSGIAYCGGITHDGLGDMVLAGPFQVMPGSSTIISQGEYYVVRVAADSATLAVYVFITKQSELPFTGHQLRFILPLIDAGSLSPPPAELTLVSVRGTAAVPSLVSFDQLCLADSVIIPNLPPRADAGKDQAARICSVVQLDGTASFDPEGSPILYLWRLIDAPLGSTAAFEGADGFTLPDLVPTGFTDKFYSAEMGAEHADDPFEVDDVLLVGGITYDIIGTGVDGNGFFVQVSQPAIPDSLVNAAYKVLRQRGVSSSDTAKPTFFPDKPGIYKFDLRVNDGQLSSDRSVTIVNVLESQIPKGCTPDLGFVWRYMSDFWGLVEDKERIEVYFQALAQVAASELLTLWQIDYSKSLRDVQRTFQRRWLHYDLLLAEPLPELTVFRHVFGGLTSADFPFVGRNDISGTTVVINVVSTASPTYTITFTDSNPYTAEEFQAELTSKLQAKDSRFTTQLIPTLTGAKVRIDAPFQFIVLNTSTCPVYATNQKNFSPSGSGGMVIGTRSYKVDISLEGLGLQPDDMLVIDGQAYHVLRVIDDASDDLRFQRIVVKNDIPVDAGSVWDITGSITSRLLNFYDGLVVSGDDAVLEIFDSVNNGDSFPTLTVAATSPLQKSRIAVRLDDVDQYVADPAQFTLVLAKVVRKQYVPVDDLVEDVPCLQEFIKPSGDDAVLRRNVDFFIDDFRGHHCIRFVDPLVGDIWQGTTPDRLWAETTYIDNKPTIEGNFGLPAGFTLDNLEELSSNVDYLSAVRGLWYAYLRGPTVHNLRVGTQILLGLPFAEEDGVIQEIRTDFSPNQGRILVQDSAHPEIVRSYSYPRSLDLETNPDTGEAYKVGDSVTQFAPLVEGAEVLDYVNTPKWFEGILNQGVFFEVEKFFKFLVRVDSSAFTLSSLMFVRSFILRIKPNYTFPLFVVQVKLKDTEVSTTDEIKYNVRITFNAGACMGQAMATMFDQPRPAGGGWFSDFDGNADPDDTPVETLYPTSQAVEWGFDKKYLCPEEELLAVYCTNWPGGTVTFDNIFRFDSGSLAGYVFASPGSVTNIPAGPAGYTVPGGPFTALQTAPLGFCHLALVGYPGTDTAYDLVIRKNGADFIVQQFTVGTTGFIGQFDFSAMGTVTAGDSLDVRLRLHSGAADATVNYTSIGVRLLDNGIPWQFDGSIPAGVYCNYSYLVQP